MTCSAKVTSTPEILSWRDMYRHEMNCQIIHDSLHVRSGWTTPYCLFVDDIPVGYGVTVAAGPWAGNPTIFEFYVQPQFRMHLFALFQALLETTGAKQIDTQSNDPLLTPMLLAFASDVQSESILFSDELRTTHAIGGAQIRKAEPADRETLQRLDLDEDAGWILMSDGQIVGTGGILFHYNRPYGDIYMKVVEAQRRRGFGAYLVQELKRICYEQGNVPAARCNPTNVASRQTLQKAGFVPCGHILTGRMTSSDRPST